MPIECVMKSQFQFVYLLNCTFHGRCADDDVTLTSSSRHIFPPENLHKSPFANTSHSAWFDYGASIPEHCNVRPRLNCIWITLLLLNCADVLLPMVWEHDEREAEKKSWTKTYKSKGTMDNNELLGFVFGCTSERQSEGMGQARCTEFLTWPIGRDKWPSLTDLSVVQWAKIVGLADCANSLPVHVQEFHNYHELCKSFVISRNSLFHLDLAINQGSSCDWSEINASIKHVIGWSKVFPKCFF